MRRSKLKNRLSWRKGLPHYAALELCFGIVINVKEGMEQVLKNRHHDDWMLDALAALQRRREVLEREHALTEELSVRKSTFSGRRTKTKQLQVKLQRMDTT